MYAPFLTYYFSISRKKYGQENRKVLKIKARQTKVMNCGTLVLLKDSPKVYVEFFSTDLICFKKIIKRRKNTEKKQ